MCVIVVKESGVSWPGKRYMRNCFLENSHGAGLAWADAEGVHVEKGYFSWGPLWRDLKALEDYPVLVHFRLATHGSINEENCHPFLLKNGTVMAHNGVLSIEPLQEDMTDSESFGKKYLEKFTAKDLKKDHVKGLIEVAIGSSKIALLNPDGSFTIFNRSKGVDFKGVWFSNDSYEDPVRYDYNYGYDYGKYNRLPDNWWRKENSEAAKAEEEYWTNKAKKTKKDSEKDPFYVEDEASRLAVKYCPVCGDALSDVGYCYTCGDYADDFDDIPLYSGYLEEKGEAV